MTDRYAVTVGGDVEIHVRVDGPVDGSPVVLLHGYLGTGRQWDDNVAPLVEAGYRVLRPDHRGHGESSHLGDESAYTFEHLRRDAVAVADAFELDRFHLVGHSMGGLVAQLVAIHDQDRLASLVLVDCSPTPGREFDGDLADDRPADAIWSISVPDSGTETTRIRAAPSIGDRLRRFVGYRIGPRRMVHVLAPALRHVTVGSPPGRTTAERRAALLDLEQSLAQLDPAAFVAFGERLGRHEDLRPFLPSIEVPTTLVVGAHEIPRLAAGTAALRDGIPDARLVEIEGAAHSPPMEQPARFNRALLAHLLRVDPPG